MEEILASLGISLEGTFPSDLSTNLEEALLTIVGEEKLRLWLNNKPVTLRFGGKGDLEAGTYHGFTSKNRISFFANKNVNPVINILHEFGHVVDNLWDDSFTNSLEKVAFRMNEAFFGGWNGMVYLGLRRDIIRTKVLKQSRVAGGDAWQQRGGTAHWEDWADIFSNAMLDNINGENEVGQQILNFVEQMESQVRGTDATAA